MAKVVITIEDVSPYPALKPGEIDTSPAGEFANRMMKNMQKEDDTFCTFKWAGEPKPPAFCLI